MLAIFDVDGTICDTQGAEDACYTQAILEVTGHTLGTADWARYEEPTSSAIVRSLLAGASDSVAKELEIKNRYVRLLEEVRPRLPGDFSPITGAVEFIHQLGNEGVCSIAIASGGFDTEAAFKLKCCGISIHDFPHATSSDTSRRRDILPLAAQRAGFDLSAAIYFGDAPWDVEVSGVLGIPMIGIGRRIDDLRALGTRDLFRDYQEPAHLIESMRKLSRRQPDD